MKSNNKTMVNLMDLEHDGKLIIDDQMGNSNYMN